MNLVNSRMSSYSIYDVFVCIALLVEGRSLYQISQKWTSIWTFHRQFIEQFHETGSNLDGPLLQVSVNKNTPPEKKTCGKNSFQSTKSEGGYQFLLLDCRARARTKRVFFSQAPVCRQLVDQVAESAFSPETSVLAGASPVFSDGRSVVIYHVPVLISFQQPAANLKTSSFFQLHM